MISRQQNKAICIIDFLHIQHDSRKNMEHTTDTDVGYFEIHFQIVIAWHSVVNLVTDSQTALRFAGTQST